MNKNLIFIGLLSILSFYNCNSGSQQQTNIEESVNTFQSISEEDISKIQYTEYILDRQTKLTIEQWQKHNELQSIITNIKIADFSFFIYNTDVLLAFLKDLKETTPERINTPAIQARLIALETVFLKFEDQLMRANATKGELLEVVKEVLVSFSNLNLQINKKFEKEAQNIQKP